MSHNELQIIPNNENINNDLNIIFEILGVSKDSTGRLKTGKRIYDSVDQFLKIFIEMNKINYPKQSLRIAKDLLEEELGESALYKDILQDYAGFIVACVGIFLLWYVMISGVLVDTIAKRFAILASTAGALIIVFKFLYTITANNKINRLKRCLMVVNQIIDKIEEDKKYLLQQWEKPQ